MILRKNTLQTEHKTQPNSMFIYRFRAFKFVFEIILGGVSLMSKTEIGRK